MKWEIPGRYRVILLNCYVTCYIIYGVIYNLMQVSTLWDHRHKCITKCCHERVADFHGQIFTIFCNFSHFYCQFPMADFSVGTLSSWALLPPPVFALPSCHRKEVSDYHHRPGDQPLIAGWLNPSSDGQSQYYSEVIHGLTDLLEIMFLTPILLAY